MTHLSCNPVTDNTGTSLCRGALGKDRIHLDFTLQVKHGICHSCNPSTLGPTGEELEFKASLDYGTKLLIKNKQTKKKTDFAWFQGIWRQICLYQVWTRYWPRWDKWRRSAWNVLDRPKATQESCLGLDFLPPWSSWDWGLWCVCLAGESCVCMCMCVRVCDGEYEHVCRAQRSTSNDFYDYFLPWFLRQNLLLDLELGWLAGISASQPWANQHTPPYLALTWMLGLMLTWQAHTRLSHPPPLFANTNAQIQMHLPQWWAGYRWRERAKDVTRVKAAALKTQAGDDRMPRSLSVRPYKVYPFVLMWVRVYACVCVWVTGVYRSWYA